MSFMANSLLLLLLFLFTTTTISASPPPPSSQEEQLNTIIDALIGAGDFNSWANMLSAADPTAFPLRATFFVPSDSEESPPADRMAMVMGYHTVPERLPFSQLLLLNPLTRLPTLLPAKSILITNNSPSNFTLDDTRISHPDLYTTPTFAVHGIQTLLNYSFYGAADTHFTPPPPPHRHSYMRRHPPSPPRPMPPPPQPKFTIGSSDAARLRWELLAVVLLVVCGVWIQEINSC